MAALSQVPPTIPTLNREAWLELSRAAANLNQLARHLNEGNEGAQHETGRITSELREFRAALLGIRFDDGDEDESESE